MVIPYDSEEGPFGGQDRDPPPPVDGVSAQCTKCHKGLCARANSKRHSMFIRRAVGPVAASGGGVVNTNRSVGGSVANRLPTSDCIVAGTPPKTCLPCVALCPNSARRAEMTVGVRRDHLRRVRCHVLLSTRRMGRKRATSG